MDLKNPPVQVSAVGELKALLKRMKFYVEVLEVFGVGMVSPEPPRHFDIRNEPHAAGFKGTALHEKSFEDIVVAPRAGLAIREQFLHGRNDCG